MTRTTNLAEWLESVRKVASENRNRLSRLDRENREILERNRERQVRRSRGASSDSNGVRVTPSDSESD
jgi:hypothetical protein